MNTVKPLVDALASGVIRGVVGVVGCNNAKTPSNYKHLTVMKELIKNDYLVVCTGCAHEWMSEKAIAIGTYVVGSGIETFLGVMPPVTGSSRAVEILCGSIKDKVGACFHVNEDAEALAQDIMACIEAKRPHFEELYQEKVLNKRVSGELACLY